MHYFRLLIVLSAAAASVSAHATIPSRNVGSYRSVTGSWGGNHVSLTFGPSGATAEYDCGTGEITGPLRTNRAGQFFATGYHAPGMGGPVRMGNVPPRFPASYSGRVKGDSMTLVVRIPSTGVQLGPLKLRRNGKPSIVRCY